MCGPSYPAKQEQIDIRRTILLRFHILEMMELLVEILFCEETIGFRLCKIENSLLIGVSTVEFVTFDKFSIECTLQCFWHKEENGKNYRNINRFALNNPMNCIIRINASFGCSVAIWILFSSSDRFIPQFDCDQIARNGKPNQSTFIYQSYSLFFERI